MIYIYTHTHMYVCIYNICMYACVYKFLTLQSIAASTAQEHGGAIS